MKGQKIVAYMPIKTKNLRCPGKNTRKLGGRPLLTYVVEAVRRVSLIDDFFIFCSDESIKEYIPGDVIFLKRPKDLDSDDTLGNQIYSAFHKLVDADIYILLHATSPFIQSNTIEEAIRWVHSGKYDTSTTVFPWRSFAWHKERALNYNVSNPPRTQDLEPILLETSALYCYTKEHWEKNKTRIGGRTRFVETGLVESLDIDSEEDFSIAEKYLR